MPLNAKDFVEAASGRRLSVHVVIGAPPPVTVQGERSQSFQAFVETLILFVLFMCSDITVFDQSKMRRLIDFIVFFKKSRRFVCVGE